MPYQVPQNIDSNKVFLVNFSELEDRLDPQFYKRHFAEILEQVKNCTHSKRFGQIVRFSSEFWNQKDYYEDSFPYIEIGAINIDNGTINEVHNIPVKDAPSRARVVVRTDDIIISTTRPNRGAIVKISEQENLAIASTGFAVIRDIVDSSVSRDYLAIVLRLNFMLEQLLQRSTGGNYPAITQEELSKILVPIPSASTQQQIVEQYNYAKEQKLQKEQEAKDLLNSIDDYLMSELGIECPTTTPKENGRFFYTSYKEVIGKRLDPSVYKPQVKFHSALYPNVRLSQIAQIDPATNFNGLTSDDTISFLPMEDMMTDKSIVIPQKETLVSKSNGYTRFQENDLLWAKISPCMQNGKSAIVRDLRNGVGCGSTEYFVIRPKENSQVLVEYLYLLLHHPITLTNATNYLGGTAGQQRVSASFLKDFVLPLPPISVQECIIKYYNDITTQIQCEITEANEIFNTTKQQIEQMILGHT